MPISSKKTIYLDYNATTPVDREVVAKMQPYFTNAFGNPSSLHQLGREARNALENARSTLARLINARESEIHFVSGGTEANNLAIQGIAYKNREKGNHIITSRVEHPSVLNTCVDLEANGFKVTYLEVDKYGQITPEDVKAAIRPETVLISIIHGNNEVGALNPIAKIGSMAREHHIYFHSDAVQSFGKMLIDVQRCQLDLLSISGHKIYGPKGIGALYIRKGVQISKLSFGGEQEHHRRAGTENLPGIIGLAEAAKKIHDNLEKHTNSIGQLREYFQKEIENKIEGIHFNGHPSDRLYNTLNVSFLGCNNELLLLLLDMKGIAVSIGSACTAGKVKTSHVLRAMGLPNAVINSAIRFSLGKDNTKEEIDLVIDILQKAVSQLRGS